MKILVIGGAGYIGSHVTREFLDRGYEVTVFDNLSTGRSENLFDEADFVRGDILSGEELAGVMKRGFDGCVHLAALKAAGVSMLRPEEYSVTNICGTIAVINQAVNSGIGCFLFSSSAAIFGSPKYQPIDEDHPKEPENYYGFTKLEIERILEWYDRLKGLRFASVRYFNAAGFDVQGRIKGLERNPENLLPIVMEAALGVRPGLSVFGDDYPTRDGTCIRDYVHVSDLASAHVSAFEYVQRQGKSLSVNLGSELGVSVLEMIDHARRVTGRPIPAAIAPRRAGDPPCLVASSAKARELLGWVPRYSSAETLIESTWNVYRNVFEQHGHL
ncbi:MAG: UDP-glucose 4-epimerase GalE [Chlorobiaceae bacterium]|nr:UDP-glucose 4-epimerase GalE [Chlorobiaceae bacterium]NTW73364.1 UDP-glucose 4-epimerase GalE [Chlorobiaceae bacterium]